MKKFTALFVLTAFLFSCITPPQGFAQTLSAVGLMPEVGAMVTLTPAMTPAHLRGMVIHPNEPFKFDFIIDQGDKKLEGDAQQAEYQQLIKYFLAALATPDTDQWVNLSPYEQDRIIPDNFGLTEMGRDLLAQDYLLKQISASLTNPDTDLGKKFWNSVYSQAHAKFGTTDVPTDIVNKIWVTPDKADVYEKGNMMLVVDSHLKVMTETDYLATRSLKAEAAGTAVSATEDKTRDISLAIMREIIIPAIEKEVNEGTSFAPVRQVYSGMLLATWYKMTLKESILAKVYGDRSKVKGIDQDPAKNKEIYQKYVAAFKAGVYNMIKEDVDRYSQETIPRKYFSGGVVNNSQKVMKRVTDLAGLSGKVRRALTQFVLVAALFAPAKNALAEPAYSPTVTTTQGPHLKPIIKTAHFESGMRIPVFSSLRGMTDTSNLLTEISSGRFDSGGMEDLTSKMKELGFSQKKNNDGSVIFTHKKDGTFLVLNADGSVQGRLQEQIVRIIMKSSYSDSVSGTHSGFGPLFGSFDSFIEECKETGVVNETVIALIQAVSDDFKNKYLGAYTTYALEGVDAEDFRFIVSTKVKTETFRINLDTNQVSVRPTSEFENKFVPWVGSERSFFTTPESFKEECLKNGVSPAVINIFEKFRAEYEEFMGEGSKYAFVKRLYDGSLIFYTWGKKSEITGGFKVNAVTGAVTDEKIVENAQKVADQAAITENELKVKFDALEAKMKEDFKVGNNRAIAVETIRSSPFLSFFLTANIDSLNSHLGQSLRSIFENNENEYVHFRYYIAEMLAGKTAENLIAQDKHNRKLEDNAAGLKGGIDFAQSNLDMQIKRDGAGIVLPVGQQDLENIKIDGLVPEILSIQPAAGSPLFRDIGITAS
ncbi:MAG: hypothetical protein WCI27_00490 [Candidatus Omnitrophota bacterium]